MFSSIRSPLVAFLLLSFSAVAAAATPIPYTFTAGTPASAAEMNANFQALAAAIDKLSSTTPTVADLAGTYRLTGFQTELGPAPATPSTTLARTMFQTFAGTVTLAADGTATISFTVHGATLTDDSINPITSQPNLHPFSITAINQTPTFSTTWSIVGGNTVAVQSGGEFSIVAGGKLLIDTHSADLVPNVHGATSTVLVLTRQ